MKYICLIMFLFFSSCDFLTTRTDAIVGKFYVLSPYTEQISNRKYLFVYIDGTGINNNIIEESVVSIQGNDSALILNSIGKDNLSHFYLVRHKKGEHPYSIDTLNQDAYLELLSLVGKKYEYHRD